MRRQPPIRWPALAAGVVFATASADDAPTPPPSAQAIKACVQQMDMGNGWRFVWKSLEIGSPRLARNSYEALYAPMGSPRAHLFGYPVHVVFSVNGHTEIDS